MPKDELLLTTFSDSNYDILEHDSNIKFLFYESLKNDELVTTLNVREDIILLSQKIENYINLSNLVLEKKKSSTLEKTLNDISIKKGKDLESAISNLQKISTNEYQKRFSPISLDFEEISQFAYSIATSTGYIYNKTRNVQSDYLEEGLESLNYAYDRLLKKGVFNPSNFSYDLKIDLTIINNPENDIKIRQYALNSFFKKSIIELNQSGNFLRLKELKNELITYTKNKPHDLNEKQIKNLANYMKTNAEIKITKFKLMHHLALMLRGDKINAFKETQKVYNQAMKMYQEFGIIQLDYQTKQD